MGAGGMGGVQDPLLGRCQGVAMATGGCSPWEGAGGCSGMRGARAAPGGRSAARTPARPRGGAPKPRGVPKTRRGGKQSPEAQRHAEAAPGGPVPEDCRLKPRRG